MSAILSGEPGYHNYWGGFVGAWTALVLGAVVLGIALFFGKAFDTDRKKSMLKGRAARKARQAERHRSPVEDFDRPWTGSR